jgi:SAM-dependent methyltransferase
LPRFEHCTSSHTLGKPMQLVYFGTRNMPAAFQDHFSPVAADYRTYRPVYPPRLFTFLAESAKRHDLVWDCGTGSGQAAVALAEHFAKVFATDASAEQVKNAERHPRVEYAVAPAEKCPLPDNCVDLVTVAQALHWFDHDKFYAEVRRVCREGALVAVWTYDFHSVSAEIDPVLEHLQNEFIRPYWPAERKFVEAGYKTIPFPFEEVPTPKFEMTADWDLARLLGYMNTWSAVRQYEKKHGVNPVGAVRVELSRTWGDPATVRTVRWQFHIRVGRVK